MATTYTYSKDGIGKEDIVFKTSGTTEGSWSRLKSDGTSTHTIKKIDANHIQFQSVAKQIEDIIDGGYDVTIKPQAIVVGAGNLDIYSGYDLRLYSDAGSTAKYTVDSADGSGTRVLSNDKYSATTKAVSDIDTSTWTGYYQDYIDSNYIQPSHVVTNTVTHTDGGVSGADANWTCCYLANNDVNITHRYDNRSMGFVYNAHLQSPVYDGGAFRSFILMDATEAYSNADDGCDADVITWGYKVDGTARMVAAFAEGLIVVENCGASSSIGIGLHGRCRVKDSEASNLTAYGVILDNETSFSGYSDFVAESALLPRGKFKCLIDTQYAAAGTADKTTITQFALDLGNATYSGTAEAIRCGSGNKIVLDNTTYDATHVYWISDDGVKTKHVYHPTVVKTTTYTATTTDCVFLVTAASPWTLTLPAALGNTGLTYYIKKTDATANAITIDGSGSEAIDGATTNADINAQYDAMTIVCDGSNWHIIQRWIQ